MRENQHRERIPTFQVGKIQDYSPRLVTFLDNLSYDCAAHMRRNLHLLQSLERESPQSSPNQLKYRLVVEVSMLVILGDLQWHERDYILGIREEVILTQVNKTPANSKLSKRRWVTHWILTELTGQPAQGLPLLVIITLLHGSLGNLWCYFCCPGFFPVI